MFKDEIVSILSAYLQTCKCNIKSETPLKELGLVGENLRNFKNLLQHNYGTAFFEHEYHSWNTVHDIVRNTESKIRALF